MQMREFLRIKYIMPAVALLALFLAAGTLAFLSPWKNNLQTQVIPVSPTGTFLADTSGTPLPFPENPLSRTTEAEEVILTVSLGENLPAHTQLFFLIEYMEVHIYLDGAEIYSFGAPGSHPATTRSSGMAWNHCVLPRDLAADDEIVIVMRNKYENNYTGAYQSFVQSMCVGDSGALARMLWKENWPYLIVGLLFLFICIMMLIFGLLLSMQKIKVHYSVYYFPCYAIVMSLWMLLTPRLSTLLLSNAVAVMQLETLCLLAFCPLFIICLGSFLHEETRRFNQGLLMVSLIVTVPFLLIQMTGAMDAYAIRAPMMLYYGPVGLVCIGEILYDIKRYKEPKRRILFIPILIFSFFVILELANYELEFFPAGSLHFVALMVLGSFLLFRVYRYISSAILRANQATKLESELAQSRIAIMLSQIKPHFLFNSLAAIEGLCQSDPGRAERAVGHFADFLRGNLDALTTDALIPFERELYHTGQYLDLEQMRFGERLRVICDTPVTKFSLPSLTLQPIVENAVRHGLMKRCEGGTVTIRTAESETCFLIVVCDDGVGFDTAAPLSGPFETTHIGIDNVRERLHVQCGGTLEIRSTRGEGTSVTIRLPKEKRDSSLHPEPDFAII